MEDGVEVPFELDREFSPSAEHICLSAEPVLLLFKVSHTLSGEFKVIDVRGKCTGRRMDPRHHLALMSSEHPGICFGLPHEFLSLLTPFGVGERCHGDLADAAEAVSWAGPHLAYDAVVVHTQVQL